MWSSVYIRCRPIVRKLPCDVVTSLAAVRTESTTRGRMHVREKLLSPKFGENPAQSHFEKPSAVHHHRILPKSEAEEDGEPKSNTDPAVKSHTTVCRYQEDVPPFFPMYNAPAIRLKRKGGIAIEDIALHREEDS